MSGATEILTILASRGATVTPVGDHIRITGPRGCLTPELKQELLAIKLELLEFLSVQERILSMGLDDFETQSFVLRVEVSWARETIWFVPGDVQARVLASGGVPRGRIWTAAELRYLTTIPALEETAVVSVGRVKETFDACVVAVGSLPPEEPDQTDHDVVACHVCRARSFWRSIYGTVVCARCHPPAADNLVAQWLTAPDRGRGDDHD